MDITWLGHSSFRLNGKTGTVVTDPYDSATVGLKFPPVSADIVTVSHQHDDHNNTKAVKDVRKVVDGPGEYEIQGISLIGISSFHDDEKGQKRGSNTIFVIEMDKLRLCHLGDLGHALEKKQLDLIGDIDVLMVPVGGTYTLNYKAAEEVTRKIEPRVIIPMHYKHPEMKSDLAGKLAPVEPFVTGMGAKVKKESKLKLNLSSLPEDEQQIVLLELK